MTLPTMAKLTLDRLPGKAHSHRRHRVLPHLLPLAKAKWVSSARVHFIL
jgi:hypothetical protein